MVIPPPSHLYKEACFSTAGHICHSHVTRKSSFIFVFLNLEIIVPESISEGQTQLLPFVPRRVLGRITVGAQICLFLMLRLGLHSHRSVVIRSTGSWDRVPKVQKCQVGQTFQSRLSAFIFPFINWENLGKLLMGIITLSIQLEVYAHLSFISYLFIYF